MLADDVHVGDRILINDGLIELVVLDVAKPRVTARVLHGGAAHEPQGDQPARRAACRRRRSRRRTARTSRSPSKQDLEYIALSFVRRAGGHRELRAMMPKSMLVVAKIEKDSALREHREASSARPTA